MPAPMTNIRTNTKPKLDWFVHMALALALLHLQLCSYSTPENEQKRK
jgi:hypothetical protein